MKFEDFIRTPKCLAMAITVEEYWRIRPLLQEFYSTKDIENIDDFCQLKPPFERFLLCNPRERTEVRTVMMLFNAVTFVDRIPFEKIEFPCKEG